MNIPPKTNLFGKPHFPTSNTYPFHSTNGESNPPFTNKNNSSHPELKLTYSPSVIKSPFAQPQSQANGSISQAQANASIMLNNSKQSLIASQSNPFAHIHSQANTAHINSYANSAFLPASTQKTSNVPFKPQEQTMTSQSANNFFNKAAVSTSGMSSPMNAIFNKNGTNQQATSTGLFTNTQHGFTNNTSNNKIFSTNNNIFSQTQSQTGNTPKTIFMNNSQGQQTATNGQTPNSLAYNTQKPTSNIFNNDPQNKPPHSIFNNNQIQNSFTQEQQPIQFNQHTQIQANIDINRAISQYFQLYKQNLIQRHPFQHSAPAKPHTPQANYQCSPQQLNPDYYLFLNTLLNNEALRKNATPREIFEFAEGWISTMSQQKQQQNLPAEQQEAKKEIAKLFDLKIDPTLYDMRMKELPPIQFTIETLQKMNDPFSCKMIVSQLWLRLKERFCVIMNSVRSVVSDSGCIKIKELPYYNQMLVMRKELQSMVKKMRELKQKDKQIKRDKHDHSRAIKATLQSYKNTLSEVNINNKMLESANEDLEKMLDYVEKNLKTLFKAYIEKEPISFQDPDQFMLSVSQRISCEINALSRMVDDHLAIENNTDQTVDFLELAENVCKFYQEIATKLYTVREKIKKIIQTVAQYKSYGSYQQLQSKIEEKAKTAMDQKMAVYNCIRDIEEILDGNFQVERKQNKKESLVGSRLSRKTLSLQEIKTRSE